MSRRSCISLLAAFLAWAAVVAGCGGATATAAATARLTPSPSPAVSAAASTSDVASGSPGASASASAGASDSLGLPHVNAALEDKLPNSIGNVTLEKFSQPLSSWIASTQGGEAALYAPWLVKFGKTPEDVDIAIAADLSYQESFRVDAIEVPGVDAATLQSDFGAVASKAGWPVTAQTLLEKSVLKITDPTAASAGILGVGYVYAEGDILYTIVTDDSSLLVEALIKLP